MTVQTAPSSSDQAPTASSAPPAELSVEEARVAVAQAFVSRASAGSTGTDSTGAAVAVGSVVQPSSPETATSASVAPVPQFPSGYGVVSASRGAFESTWRHTVKRTTRWRRNASQRTLCGRWMSSLRTAIIGNRHFSTVWLLDAKSVVGVFNCKCQAVRAGIRRPAVAQTASRHCVSIQTSGIRHFRRGTVQTMEVALTARMLWYEELVVVYRSQLVRVRARDAQLKR
eukprot:4442450-Amphidinium_carterae.1